MGNQETEDLDIHEPGFVLDPYPTYERLRLECPAMRSEQYGGFWLLTRYDDVKQAAMDWRGLAKLGVSISAD